MNMTSVASVLTLVGMTALAGCAHQPMVMSAPLPITSSTSLGQVTTATASAQAQGHMLYMANVKAKVVAILPNNQPASNGNSPVYRMTTVEGSPYQGTFAVSFDLVTSHDPITVGKVYTAAINYPYVSGNTILPSPNGATYWGSSQKLQK